MALVFPTSPTNGQVFTDTGTGNRYVYDASKGVWKYSSNNVGVTVGTVPPPINQVAPGAMWYNTNTGRTFILYDDGDSKQWVENIPAPGNFDSSTVAGYANAATQIYLTPVYTNANAAFRHANSAFDSANNVAPAYNTANGAFAKANNALANTTGTFAGDLTFTGFIVGKTNNGGNIGSSNDSGSMSIRGDNSNAASISFHRPLSYAINMGLDTDNFFRIGGWSDGASGYRIVLGPPGGSHTLNGTLTTSSRGIAKASMPAGTVLQVVSAVKKDTSTCNSTTFVDVSGLSLNITPTSSTSKILVIASVALGALNEGALRLLRDGVLIDGSTATTAPSTNFTVSVDDGLQYATMTGTSTIYDSPGTTNPVTYKVQFASMYGTGRYCYVNRYHSAWETTYGAGTTSTIIAMEIAQ